jgi:hypothetical protein
LILVWGGKTNAIPGNPEDLFPMMVSDLVFPEFDQAFSKAWQL